MNSLSRYFEKEKDFFSTFFKIAVPVAIQYFFFSSLNLIDNIMVGQLGNNEVAAVGFGNQFYFVLQLFLLGVAGGTAMFVSQFWGKKDLKNAKHVLGLSLIIAAAAAFLFFLAALIVPETIMGFFTANTDVRDLGVSYLQICAVSYLLMAVSTSYAATLRSIHEAVLPMQANIIGIALNTTFNYFFIFGNFGFPALGVPGAAIATVIARGVEMAYLLVRLKLKRHPLITGFTEFFRISSALVKRFIKKTSVVVGKDVIWGIGVSIYMSIYGHMEQGKEGESVAATAMTITNTIRNLSTVLIMGVANACLIMVGNALGAEKLDTAYNYARRFLRLTVGLGILCGLTVIAFRHLLLSPYQVSEEVVTSTLSILLIYGAVYFIYSFNMVAVVGVMRSGGDNFFCAVMDTIAVYFIGLPLALVGAFVWQLSVEGVFILIAVQEIFKAVLLFFRFRSRRWMKNMVEDLR